MDNARTEFTDDDRPLKISDAERQGDVTRRIFERRKALGLNQGDIGKAWGVGRVRAGQLLSAPGQLDQYRVSILCEVLRCDLEWLREGGEVVRWGYESADVVTRLYEQLAPSDKALVFSLIERLSDPEAVENVRRDHLRRQIDQWSDGRREKDANTTAPVKPWWSSLSEHGRNTIMATLQDYVRDGWAAQGYGVADLIAIDKKAEELEAKGFDTDDMSTDMLYQLVMGDFKEVDHRDVT